MRRQTIDLSIEQCGGVTRLRAHSAQGAQFLLMAPVAPVASDVSPRELIVNDDELKIPRTLKVWRVIKGGDDK